MSFRTEVLYSVTWQLIIAASLYRHLLNTGSHLRTRPQTPWLLRAVGICPPFLPSLRPHTPSSSQGMVPPARFPNLGPISLVPPRPFPWMTPTPPLLVSASVLAPCGPSSTKQPGAACQSGNSILSLAPPLPLQPFRTSHPLRRNSVS